MKSIHTTVRRLLIASAMMLSATFSFAQVKIGNNPTTLNANAALDVESTTRGILFPRVSLTSLAAPAPLTAHVAGMQVYNTNTGADVDPGVYYNDGTKWVRVGADVEKVFYFGSGAPSGSCTVGTMYVDTLENSATEGDTWTCIAGAWQPYTPPPTPTNPSTTPFYLARTTVDAKGNKVSSIYRKGLVGINATYPRAQLHMQGQFLMTRDGSSAAGIPVGGHAQGGITAAYSTGAPTGSFLAIQNSGGVGNIFLSKRTAAAGDHFVRFSQNGVNIANISRTATGISYGTTSDVRLKENIKPTHYGVSDLMKIQVRDYNYITDKKTPVTGFIAQQLYEVFPIAVTVGGKDAKTNPWNVDYGKVTPLLVKAIQDQQKQIEKLNGLQAANEKLTAQNEQLRQDLGKVAALNAKLEQMQAQLAQLLTTTEKSAAQSK